MMIYSNIQLNADTLYEETQNEITFRVQVNEPVPRHRRELVCREVNAFNSDVN